MGSFQGKGLDAPSMCIHNHSRGGTMNPPLIYPFNTLIDHPLMTMYDRSSNSLLNSLIWLHKCSW